MVICTKASKGLCYTVEGCRVRGAVPHQPWWVARGGQPREGYLFLIINSQYYETLAKPSNNNTVITVKIWLI